MMRAFFSYLSLTAASAFLFLPLNTSAQSTAAQEEMEINAIMREAGYNMMIRGQTWVKLIDQAEMLVTKSMMFMPGQVADRLMIAYGNSTDPTLVGMVQPLQQQDDWWTITVAFNKAGYIKDDDAKIWDVNALLDSLREGAEQANKERKQRGFPEVVIDGWGEKPQYDSRTQRLVWSITIKEKGETADDNPMINYNTYILGRDGYITLSLIVRKNGMSQGKNAVLVLLDDFQYVKGKRYTDFNVSTDKIAEYNLAALIADMPPQEAEAEAEGWLGGLWKRLRGKKAKAQQP